MRKETIGRILRGEKVHWEEKVVHDEESLASLVGYLRAIGISIVVTTGSFDLYHVGHKRYLEAARGFGDVLIVEVDSDELVRERKPDNPHRPIVPLEERLETMSGAADWLFPLYPCEDTTHFIQVIQPDVLVVSRSSSDSGEEYQAQVRPYCRQINILDPQAETSTSARIALLQKAGMLPALTQIKTIVDDLFAEANGKKKKEEENA